MKTPLLILLVLLFVGCSNDIQENKKAKTPGMKCGAGKCGANMFDGNAALAKKKKNILNQMRKDDPRKDCVLKAKTTKSLYDCVRSPKSGKLSLKCGTGKCGNSTKTPQQPTMKCGAGKCGKM